jgi:Asp-tRNA(Asn)/Glu-tRNA(Gln) amidotransferase A subunit family amidase
VLADAVETAGLVRARELGVGEAVVAAIGRAEMLNPTLNAIVEPSYDEARDRARSGTGAGALAGVPILLKDLFCPRAGDRAYQGNRLLRSLDYRYRTTGNVARRLLGAGAVSVGRSHSPEFGSGNCPASAETDLYGPTRNPWDLTRTPLGSSGGAAAAVAAGIVPLAHASDGGGSIRLPASACGLVGLKPSRARISAAPSGENWAGGVTDGVVSRTVRDSALGLDVLAGPEPGDPYASWPHEGSWLAEVGRQPGRLRVGLCDEVAFAGSVDECRQAVGHTGQLLESLGHHVERAYPAAMDSNDFMYDYIRVIRASLTATLADLSAAVIGRPWRPEDVEAGTWTNHQRGTKISAADYVASRERLTAFTRSMVPWWEEHDLLATPTVATTPPPLGHLVHGDERELTRRLAAVTVFVTQFNVTGQPAITLPLHWTAAGLPVGVQLVAAPGREDILLRVGAQLEAAAPWHHRYPNPS